MKSMAKLMYVGDAMHDRAYGRRPLGYIAAVVATLVLVSSTTASAQVLSIQSSDREVAAFGTSTCLGCGENGEDVIVSNGNSIPSTQLGVFDENVFSLGSSAFQQSTVSPHLISGTGGNLLGGSGSNDGLSSMLVDFTVLQTGLFQLTGEISVNTFNSSDNTAQVILGSSGGDLLNEVVFNNGTISFDESYLLEAGTIYTLDISIEGNDFGLGSEGGWTVNLVPEPSTAVLIGAFGLAVGARRHKRRVM